MAAQRWTLAIVLEVDAGSVEEADAVANALLASMDDTGDPTYIGTWTEPGEARAWHNELGPREES